MPHRNIQPILEGLLSAALKKGADGADAVCVRGQSRSASVRQGKREDLDHSEGADLGFRVLVGTRQAIVSSTLSKNLFRPDDLIDRALAMARAVPEDPSLSLAREDQLSKFEGDLRTFDDYEPSTEELFERAAETEQAGLEVRDVANSGGASAGWSSSEVWFAGSNGFFGSYKSSGSSCGLSLIAGEGNEMVRDYAQTSAIFNRDLRPAAEVGQEAGERVTKRLGQRKVKSGTFPVIFEPRVANSLLGSLASAINGASIARGTSFLKEKLGDLVFSENITVVDDPHIIGGRRSRAFDGEGLKGEKINLIEGGRLTTWLLDLSTATQLGLESNARAARGVSSPPSPSATNLYFEPGAERPEILIGQIDRGLYVTEMMGHGANIITGDYSRGASGFWIENGKIAFPVTGVTIASTLQEMFSTLILANDLTLERGINSPTLLVPQMTIAGES
ncbi:TldD/PmbA family protein [Alphaproteobacteria bacterium]|nr:TldD/PmbA family protein [Alphaproteobacteria bacterium]